MDSLFPRFKSLWFGLTLPWRSAKLIASHTPLLIWSIVPILITLVLYFYVIAGLQDWAQTALKALLLDYGFDADSWVSWLVVILSKLLLFLIAALTFTFTSSIMASPFNDLLAEKTEKYLDPKLPAVPPANFQYHFKIIGIDLIKTGATMVAGFLAFLFSFIPIINIITFVAVFLLVTFQYTSYPQTRRQIPLQEGAKFLLKHPFACTGFGATITFLYAIPLVSSFALPVAVVGGTLLVGRAQAGAGKFPLK